MIRDVTRSGMNRDVTRSVMDDMSTPYSNVSKVDCSNNYIYFYHLDGNDGRRAFLILPVFPQSFTDNLQSSFSTTNVLARSAPIYSYQYSGPRSASIQFKLHRDMMTMLNQNITNVNVDVGDDYVDTLINYLQAIALPSYSASDKMINPPMIGIRFSDQLFIKGVVNGGVTTTYSLPILSNGKYAQVEIQFTLSEVGTYDAESVINQGVLRGLSTSLVRKVM